MIPKPKTFTELIGPAADVGRLLQARLARPGAADGFTAIMFGPPGTGKTELASILAHALAEDPFSVEQLNGQDASIDVIREWRDNAPYRPLYGRRKIKHVDEIDKMSDAAQAALLTYLDKLPTWAGFVCTTNKSLADLPKRIHGRMKQYEVKSPSTQEIQTLILRHFVELNETNAAMIAMGSCGDVRAALHDADAYLDRLAL